MKPKPTSLYQRRSLVTFLLPRVFEFWKIGCCIPCQLRFLIPYSSPTFGKVLRFCASITPINSLRLSDCLRRRNDGQHSDFTLTIKNSIRLYFSIFLFSRCCSLQLFFYFFFFPLLFALIACLSNHSPKRYSSTQLND